MTGKLVLSRAERRARREIRRAKQRATNITRAQKMHKARLAAAKQQKLPGSAPPCDALAPTILNVGCSGWFYWHWRGTFYPQELPTGLWFRHYASRFKTVELNAPFYSWPTV